jgi:hypothetical protein
MARETPCRRNLEGDVSEGHDDGDLRLIRGGDPKIRAKRGNPQVGQGEAPNNHAAALIADEEEAGFFWYNCAPPKRKEAGKMPSPAMGAASPWFLVRAQKPAVGESEPN